LTLTERALEAGAGLQLLFAKVASAMAAVGVML